LLCALLACAPAHAKIVINQSIAGVSPGMTEKAIKAKLGKPTHVYKFKKQASYPGGKELVWESRKGKERRYHVPRVFVTFVNGTPGAGSVGTSSRYERTSSRLGPGASYKLLRKRLKGENCSKPPHDCIAAAPAGVKLRTDFAMAWSNGKRAGPVERVTMYMVQPTPGSGSTSPPAPTQPTLPMDQFPVPDSNGKLVAGPDGAIWMNEPTTGAIARMSADGEVTEYPLPNRNDPTAPGPPAISIAAGPDAALWFTAFDGAEYAIGRMSTAGEVTAEYPLPLSTQLGDITAGPDGALWFE
jgi:hypothetical protein